MQDERWHAVVDEMLLHAGLLGVKQVELTNRASENRRVKASEVIEYLDALRSEGKVQLFIVTGTGGRNGRVWRATTRLAEDYAQDE